MTPLPVTNRRKVNLSMRKSPLCITANLIALAFVTPSAFAAICDTSPIPINHIQGANDQSPMLGQQLTVRGVVTASWTGENELNGFYLHSLPEHDDKDSQTSEGLFVYAPGSDAFEPGTILALRGTVAEHQQQTQLEQLADPQECGQTDLPDTVTLELPVESMAEFEALEGMPVRFAQDLIVNGHYQLARFGEFVVSHERMYTPTQVVPGGAEAKALAASYPLQRLIVDDNSQRQNPPVIAFPSPELSADNTLRSGDTLVNLTGILSQAGNSNYKIQPIAQLTFDHTNPRPKAPEAPVEGSFRVASFNVLNYFNGDGNNGGFPTARGAATPAELARQEQKIVAALSALKADVVGVMEIENDGYGDHSAIAQLTAALAKQTNHSWRYIAATDSRLGGDQITNGILYRADKVAPQGKAKVLSERPFDWGSRPPLAQAFTDLQSDKDFTLVVNHFKSKGSCPDEPQRTLYQNNINANDGQACWNGLRTQSAKALSRWLAGQTDSSSAARHIVLGDFNAYAKEDPMQAFEKAGYLNLIEEFEPNGYSYVYDAQAGSLDHILVTQALAEHVLTQQHWSINADEPLAFQYSVRGKTEAQQQSWFAPDAYRSSDHDPLYIDLKL